MENKADVEQRNSETIVKMHGPIDEFWDWDNYRSSLKDQVTVDLGDVTSLSSHGIRKFFIKTIFTSHSVTYRNITPDFLHHSAYMVPDLLFSAKKIESFNLQTFCSLCQKPEWRVVILDQGQRLSSFKKGFEEQQPCRGFKCSGMQSILNEEESLDYWNELIERLTELKF